MGYFPFYIDISYKRCVIIGGGKVALRKIEKLLPFEPEITVIAPEICKEIKALDIDFHIREFRESDIDGAFMVISATDSPELNRRVFELCREKNILMNSVDDMANCGFIFPALIKKGDISIGISTSGKAPAYARQLRGKIEKVIDDNDADEVKILSEYRESLKGELSSAEQRKAAVWRKIYEDKNRNPRQQACNGSDRACNKSD